ncbi:MAG: hypothetical protein R6X20_01860 [Phycisphaerae bacterium]
MAMRRLVITTVSVLVAAGLMLPGGVRAASDEFYQGLEKRGLRTLMEAYLKQQGEAIAEAPDEDVGLPGQKQLDLAKLAVQQARKAGNMAARDQAFQQARKLYEQAIQARKKALDAIPADQLTKQNEALYRLIQARLALANMVFQQWLTTDLNLLEMTQRHGGNRQRAIELLGVATDAYAATVEGCGTWLTNLDMLPGDDYTRFTNLGNRRQVRDASRQARYFNAWAQYYLGWLLPQDYQPPEGRRNRSEILNDAITAFTPYADSDRDTNANKWYARLGIGMAYRELGEYEKALQQMAKVNPPPVQEDSPRDQSWKPDVRIRTAYEKAVTQLAMERFEAARQTIEEIRKKYGDGLKQSLYGQALPIVEAATYIEEGTAKNQAGTKEKGVGILKSLYDRPNPWPMVVQWVMRGMVGEAETGEEMPDFMLWIRANDLMAEAQKTKNAKQMKQAADLFKAYAEKVGPEDKNYPTALYTGAAALLQVGDKAEAAALFRQVADKFPEYRYAKAAANYAVGARGQVYENAKTEENRQAYEDALHWFVKNHLESDPEQAYFYALVLYRGEKYLEAADAFSRVPKQATHYPDSRYWVALCRLEHFRNRVLASRDKQLILSGARDVAKRLLNYTKYAFEAQTSDLPDEKKQQLLQWAEFAYINAADVYLYQEVSLPADALPILEEMEKRFELTKDMRGRVLKLKIDAYQKLGKPGEALRLLDQFLAVADPKDVGPVLRGLFAAMTDDVRELIKRGKKELAAAKVEQAKSIGSRFLRWLETSDLEQKQIEIENTRYDLAELYLAVSEYEQALQIYQEIAGPKPEDVKRGEPLPEDAIYGMARAHEGLADAAASSEEAKPHYERSLELWRVLLDVAEIEPQDRWERDYHLLYCKFKLGQKEEVAKAIKALELLREEPLGGADPALNKKFRELEAQVAG